MKRILCPVLLGLIVSAVPLAILATEPVPPGTAFEVSYDNLRDLGDAVSRVDDYKDNFYQYEERVCRLQETGQALQGQAISVVAVVERVTPYEVVVDIPKAGKTRIALRHQRPPLFGNLGSRTYSGPPSTVTSQIWSKPVALRIEEEISLSLAKQLRKGDRLLLQGLIEVLQVRIKSTFDPYVAAIVTDWRVSEADFASEQTSVNNFRLDY